MQHRLAIVRHAKAQESGATDIDRELADRGRSDAVDAGRWLAGWGFVPDRALVSAAARARTTYDEMAAAAGWSAEVEASRNLYAADPDSALDLVHDVPEEVINLIVVGHNPTVGSLAQLLDDGEGDPGAERDMATGFATCSVAVFAFDGSWAHLDTATLEAAHVGRG
ncbi:MAG: SixA phosphatase family protein [Nocardioides sp.]